MSFDHRQQSATNSVTGNVLVWLAVAVWLGLIVGVSVRVALAKPTSQSVVPIYLAAGERWANHEPLYRPILGLDLFRNPPGVAATFAWFQQLPEKPFALAWRWAGIGLFLFGLIRLQQLTLPALTRRQLATYHLTAAVLILPAFNNGQINLWLAGLGLVAVAWSVQRRWIAAGIGFALMGFLKIYPLAVGLLLALKRPRLWLPTFASCTLLAVTPLYFGNADYTAMQLVELVEQSKRDDRSFAPMERAPRDWTILPRVWFGLQIARPLATVVSFAVGIVMAMAILRLERRHAPMLALLFGSVWMTAFGPATEANTYTLLAGVTAWLLANTDAPWRFRWLTLSGGLLQLAAVLRGIFPNDAAFNALGPQPLGALLLLVGGTLTVCCQQPTGDDQTYEILAERITLRRQRFVQFTKRLLAVKSG